jgi:hypothetical protein
MFISHGHIEMDPAKLAGPNLKRSRKFRLSLDLLTFTGVSSKTSPNTPNHLPPLPKRTNPGHGRKHRRKPLKA